MTFQAWLLANTRAWHGWPTRSLFLDDFDAARLMRLSASIGLSRLTGWFGAHVVADPSRLYAEIASEIADVRLKARRQYDRQVAANA